MIDARMVNPGNYGKEECLGRFPARPSKYLRWVGSSDLTIWVDKFKDNNDSKYNILVLVEPMELCPENYELAVSNQNDYDMIFSTYPNFGGNDKFYYYRGGLRSLVAIENQGYYFDEKDNDICCIMSNKSSLSGHKLRREIRGKLSDTIHYRNPIEKGKSVDLRYYRYDLVIENSDYEFFSEKILDSMLCGCIPIYYTERDISYLDVFDMNGIEIFKSQDELYSKVNDNYFNKELYDTKVDAIKHNFEVAKHYASFGDVIWDSGLKQFFEGK